MRKVAIFVEGKTEAELIANVLVALCGNKGVTIEMQRQQCGVLHYIEARGSTASPFFALIANCNNDGQVLTQIRDRYASLVAAGYTRIIGLRDVYPHQRPDIQKIRDAIDPLLPVGGVPVGLHLAVLEIEAWFLDEITHFERIHPKLTIARILSAGFDIQSNFGETWAHPADTLHQIYKLEGLAYQKKAHQITRTVEALCMDQFYVTAQNRSASLASFIGDLEAALFSAAQTPAPAPAAPGS